MSGDGEDAAAVLGFWFGDLPPDQHFAKNPRLDMVIAERFGRLRETVLTSGAEGWRTTPDRLLAAIILLDQFSRNIHRGSGQAFAADPLARALALHAIGQGWDIHYTREQRRFLYLPLAHAEDADLQELSVANYEALGDVEALSAAREHAVVVRRFGRFPSRNEALGRRSTPEETAYLQAEPPRW